jgi:hypothetical protein
MPSVSVLGTDGNVFESVHASVYDALPRAEDRTSYQLLNMRSLGSASAVNASMILDAQQERTVQVLATTTSSISLVAAICAVYWFCMMRRNFRRDLVLLLIVGGSWKSLWFFVFSVVTFAGHTIESETVFCQASGYMLQVGFEMCGELRDDMQ